MKKLKQLKLSNDESILWIFSLKHNWKTKEFTVYANGKESYKTKSAETAPEAMVEYFENWDTEKVKT